MKTMATVQNFYAQTQELLSYLELNEDRLPDDIVDEIEEHRLMLNDRPWDESDDPSGPPFEDADDNWPLSLSAQIAETEQTLKDLRSLEAPPQIDIEVAQIDTEKWQ